MGAQIEAGSYLVMPNVSVLLTAGFPIVGGRLEIVPRIGGSYIFFPMSGLSGDWYVPVGAELRFPESRLGIVLENLVAIDNTFGEGGVSAGLEGYIPFAKPGKSIFSVAVEAGTAVFWNTANRPLVLVSLSASMRYEYRIKSTS